MDGFSNSFALQSGRVNLLGVSSMSIQRRYIDRNVLKRMRFEMLKFPSFPAASARRNLAADRGTPYLVPNVWDDSVPAPDPD